MSKTSVQYNPKNVNQIQFNRCYNPQCKYYLNAPSRLQNLKGFKLVSSGEGLRSFKCGGCKQTTLLKSNVAIMKELDRLSRPISTIPVPVHPDACRNIDCDNYNKRATYNPTLYKLNGKTKTGNQRYSCKICKSTFTHVVIKEKRKPNAKIHIETHLFLCVVNKVPIAGTADIFDISTSTFYEKIDRFAKKCALFTYQKEKKLRKVTKGRTLNLCTDRQDHIINWHNKKIRHNTSVLSLGTACLRSGYVFGLHLNYDPTADTDHIYELEESSNTKIPQHEREYAHIWTERDAVLAQKSTEAFKKLRKELKKLNGTGVEKDIIEQDRIEEINNELGVMLEDSRNGYANTKRGARLHSDYTLIAHFLWLSKHLYRAKKVNFYLDQEAGISRAVIGSFSQHFSGEFDAFLVALEKGKLSVDEKKTLKRDSDFLVDEIMHTQSVTGYQAKLIMLEQAISEPVTLRSYNQDKDWVCFPYSEPKEPYKMAHWITKREMPLREQARLFHNASLHAIDRFFMITRRKISSAERAFASRSQEGNKWYLYNSYDPAMLEKYFVMLKTYRNYCIADNKGNTPAMKLGLATKRYEVKDIIHR